MVADYRFEFRDIFGQEKLTEGISLQNVRFSKKINNIGSARFSVFKEQIPFATKFLIPEKTTMFIYRNDKLVWGGMLKDRVKDYAKETLAFEAETFATWLQDRFLETREVSVAINKAIFFGNEILNNITLGSFYSSILSVGTIQNGQTGSLQIGEEFENIDLLKLGQKLAKSENGFDFDVDDNGRVNTFSPQKGVIRENVILELGKNVKNVVERVVGNNIVNRLKAIGENGKTFIVNNFPSQESFRVRERIKKFDETVTDDLLQKESNFEVLKKSAIQLKHDITLPVNPSDIDISEIQTGDSVRLKIFSEIDEFFLDTFKRIEEISVSLDKEYNESINLEFFEE